MRDRADGTIVSANAGILGMNVDSLGIAVESNDQRAQNRQNSEFALGLHCDTGSRLPFTELAGTVLGSRETIK